MTKTITITCLLALGLFLATSASGQGKGKLVLTTIAEEEVSKVNAKGEVEVVRVNAGKVTPGDEIIYTIRYTNESTDRAETVVITNPVPDHMRCSRVDDVAFATISYSVDGGATFGTPESLTVVDEDDTERAAKPSDYTHIRWTLTQPVAPGHQGSVSFRAVLL